MSVTVKQGDRVVFDNGGEEHYGRKPGDLGTVVAFAAGYSDILVTVDWDTEKGEQEIVYEGRLRLADSAPAAFETGDKFVLGVSYVGEPHDLGDAVEVLSDIADPTGGVAVYHAESETTFRVHYSRLNVPAKPEPEPVKEIQVPVWGWGALTEGLDGALVAIRSSDSPDDVAQRMAAGIGDLLQMNKTETDALIAALIAVGTQRWGAR